MNEGVLQIMILVVSGLILLSLVGMAFFVHRLRQEVVRSQDIDPSWHPEDQQRQSTDLHSIAEYPPFDSVMTRLSFVESFDPERFASASQQCALSQINIALASRTGDGIALTVESLRLMPSGVEMTVSASQHGQSLLTQGKAIITRHGPSGRALPILKDARTGRFIETMKDVPGTKALSRLGAMSSAIVGAAHIISGADIAKRLKQIDSKMNLLLAFRRMDQMAKLERIYTSAKELSCGPPSKDKRWELWRLRGDLRELRCNWRRELQHHLNLIDDPSSASWFKKVFTRQKTNDRDIHGRITEGQLQLGMIEYSMRLEQVLAVGSGTINEFEGTLADELIELEAVAGILKNKAGMISGTYPDLSVDSTVDGMVAIVEQYRQLLPEVASTPEYPPLPPVFNGPTDQEGLG